MFCCNTKVLKICHTCTRDQNGVGGACRILQQDADASQTTMASEAAKKHRLQIENAQLEAMLKKQAHPATNSLIQATAQSRVAEMHDELLSAQEHAKELSDEVLGLEKQVNRLFLSLKSYICHAAKRVNAVYPTMFDTAEAAHQAFAKQHCSMTAVLCLIISLWYLFSPYLGWP